MTDEQAKPSDAVRYFVETRAIRNAVTQTDDTTVQVEAIQQLQDGQNTLLKTYTDIYEAFAKVEAQYADAQANDAPYSRDNDVAQLENTSKHLKHLELIRGGFADLDVCVRLCVEDIDARLSSDTLQAGNLRMATEPTPDLELRKRQRNCSERVALETILLNNAKIADALDVEIRHVSRIYNLNEMVFRSRYLV